MMAYRSFAWQRMIEMAHQKLSIQILATNQTLQLQQRRYQT